MNPGEGDFIGTSADVVLMIDADGFIERLHRPPTARAFARVHEGAALGRVPLPRVVRDDLMGAVVRARHSGEVVTFDAELDTTDGIHLHHVTARRVDQQRVKIHAHLERHPSRAYFSDLFKFGGFRTGVEVGVAAGRFSELMLFRGNPAQWFLVEPFPNADLHSRFGGVNESDRYNPSPTGREEKAQASWKERGISTNITFLPFF